MPLSYAYKANASSNKNQAGARLLSESLPPDVEDGPESNGRPDQLDLSYQSQNDPPDYEFFWTE